VHLAPAPAGRAPGTEHTTARGHGEEFVGMKAMRPGDDPRDIHWRKSAAAGQLVLRERARESRPDVTLTIDAVKPRTADDDWAAAFERRIREVASRAVAHLKRGDRVLIAATGVGSVRADRNVGADPLLRYLALLEPATEDIRTAAVAEAAQ
jgi:uncharacterized protein (DUF58 family)